MKIRARIEDLGGRVAFSIQERGSNGLLNIAQSVELTEIQEGGCIAPTGFLDLTEAQSLMDDLWQCGLRPTKGSGSAGSLAATEKHLNDMRKIVSKKLDVSL